MGMGARLKAASRKESIVLVILHNLLSTLDKGFPLLSKKTTLCRSCRQCWIHNRKKQNLYIPAGKQENRWAAPCNQKVWLRDIWEEVVHPGLRVWADRMLPARSGRMSNITKGPREAGGAGERERGRLTQIKRKEGDAPFAFKRINVCCGRVRLRN